MMKKLLLADDSITIQKVVGIIFSTEEYQLEMTDDGDSAFKKALEEVPDLVLADISMPGKDGFELCRAIKNEPRLANTSVLLLPGAFDHFDEIKAGEVCADGWLTKPFESQALLDKVSQLLEAEPVRMAGMEAVVAEDATEQNDIDPIDSADRDLSVDESVLGLDEIEEVTVPTDDADDESPDDIWDAVSFAEEDLQGQSESTHSESNDEVSFAADVIDPSAVDDVNIEPATDDVNPEPAADDEVLSAFAIENNENSEDPSFGKAVEEDLVEESQEETFNHVDTTEEVENTAALDPLEPVSEVLQTEALEGEESVDFSKFTEAEDEFQQSEEQVNGDSSFTANAVNEESLHDPEDGTALRVDEPFVFADEEEMEPLNLEEGDFAEEDPIPTSLASEPEVEEEVESFEPLDSSVKPDTETFTVEDEPTESDDDDVIMDLQEEDELDSEDALVVESGDVSSADDQVLDLLEDEIIEEEGFDAEAVEPDEFEPFVSEAPEPVDEVFVLSTESEESTDELVPSPEVSEAPEPVDEVFVFSDESEESTDELAPSPEVSEAPESDDDVYVLSDVNEESAVESELVTEVAEDENFIFDETATNDVGDVAITAGVAAAGAALSATEQVEQQLQELSDDELKDVVAKVAGPMIEKMAREMLEKIAWEVVPDLAEAMISEEIRKIKEGE